jgi:hypothetical protein
MEYLHDAHVANVVTSYATLLAGIMPVIYCLITRNQPGRWMLVYVCVVITAIPTIIHHQDPRVAFWTSIDVASNILLAWAIQVAVSGDFLPPEKRRTFLASTTLINSGVLAWLAYEAISGVKTPVIRFGGFGEFYVGEAALIINCWVAAGLFFKSYRRIPPQARPFLLLVFCTFLVGMGLATAGDAQISARFFAWHATWHILGAFGFMTLWVFNHLRFSQCPDRSNHVDA